MDPFIATLAKTRNQDKFSEYDLYDPFKFSEIFLNLEEELPDLSFTQCYLYHGIRFQNHLEKLESIFEKKAILAAKYLDNVMSYDDNCNDGEYVSLLKIDPFEYSSMYDAFIRPNVTLVVSPFCEA